MPLTLARVRNRLAMAGARPASTARVCRIDDDAAAPARYA